MTDELPIVLLHGSATGSYSWAAVRMGVVQGIDYLERNLRRFMRPARRHIALDMRLGSNRIEYQPLGVVGIISPWNYPVNLSLMPVVTAIADCWLAPCPLMARLACSARAADTVNELPIGVEAGATT